jgi:glycosyltransferase involved in cell wall biosynthesis
VDRQPVAFFHGTFSQHKVDRAMIEAVAAAGWRVVLAGVLPDPESERWMRQFARNDVEFLGPLQQERIVDAMADSDVLLLPYVVDEHTRFVFPLKLVEYLATGRPIVASRLPAITDTVGDLVRYAESPGQVAEALRLALDEEPSAAVARREFSAKRSWAQRLAEIEALLERPNASPNGERAS